MTILRVTLAVIYTSDFDNLIAAVRQRGSPRPGSLVGHYECATALTPTQLRRLPASVHKSFVIWPSKIETKS